MKRARIGLLGLLVGLVGCGAEEAAEGAGVKVLDCDGVTARSLVDVGLPPAFAEPIAFVPRRAGTCSGGFAAVVTLDTAGDNGALVLVNLQTFGVAHEFATHSDAAVRYIDKRLYVLNRRGADSIQVYDTENSFAQVGAEFSVADYATNIQDICCSSRDRCYVPGLDEPSVVILNLEAEDEEDRVLGTIDLSEFDEDGNPDAAACYVSGSRLAIALQRLDANYAPQTPGQIAFFDISADPPELLSVLDTAAPNPFTDFQRRSTSTAVIGEIGSFGATDGALELINIETRSSEGTLLTEAELGGDLVGFTRCSTGEDWAIGANADGDTSLYPVDLAGLGQPGNARPARIETDGWRLTGVAADFCGRIWLADRNVPTD